MFAGYLVQKVRVSSALAVSECTLFACAVPPGKDLPGHNLRRTSRMKGRALDANEIFFDDYQVPVDTLLGNRRRTRIVSRPS